jgi:hypothetical protein
VVNICVQIVKLLLNEATAFVPLTTILGQLLQHYEQSFLFTLSFNLNDIKDNDDCVVIIIEIKEVDIPRDL